MHSRELLAESFGRLPGLVGQVLDGLGEEQLAFRPAGHGNSIAWLVWHLGRVEDAQVASAWEVEQVWTAEGFVSRFGLPLAETDTGYGHSSRQVDAVRASPELLREYCEAVHRRTAQLLESVGDADLDRVVDRRWDPPVTLGVRLVSILGDCLQHAGQAAYAKGLQGPAARG